MEAPDKIYIGLINSEFGGVVYDTVSATFPNAKEYIRKEALLEWLKGCKNNPFITYLHKGYIQELIDKLNGM